MPRKSKGKHVRDSYAAEGVDLADIARHVGHSRTATTEGYVKDLGQRPRRTAEAAARVLDSP